MNLTALPAAFDTVDIETGAVLGLSDPITFSVSVETEYHVRLWAAGGTINIPAGTAGKANVASGFFLQEAGEATPSSWAAKSYGHTVVWAARSADVDTTTILPPIFIDHDIELTVGNWELYLAVGVEGEDGLGGVTVSGYAPSGFLEQISLDGPAILY